MKILWIINSILPETEALITGKKVENNSSGSWIYALAQAVVESNLDCEIIIASVSHLVKSLTYIDGTFQYVVLPIGKGNMHKNSEYDILWQQVKQRVKPDLVHIHGTEYYHGCSYVNACGAENVVVSIQGLVSVIFRYYQAGIPISSFIKNITLHDLITNFTIFHQIHNFKKRGIYEVELLKNVRNVIGRTEWDKAHVKFINSNVNYFHCDEILRNEFYTDSWKYENCTAHSIFLSQGHYPLKGLHQVLKILPKLREVYPDIKLRVGGPNILRHDKRLSLIYDTTYARILRKYIKKEGLESIVEFTGPLNAKQMKMELLNSNVYLCPSSIENSPNSLCEAQILGVPAIASFVGGIHDFIPNSKVGYLYNFNEVEVLYSQILEIFSNLSLIKIEEEKKMAQKRHDKQNNICKMLEIYSEIYNTK